MTMNNISTSRGLTADISHKKHWVSFQILTTLFSSVFFKIYTEEQKQTFFDFLYHNM